MGIFDDIWKAFDDAANSIKQQFQPQQPADPGTGQPNTAGNVEPQSIGDRLQDAGQKGMDPTDASGGNAPDPLPVGDPGIYDGGPPHPSEVPLIPGLQFSQPYVEHYGGEYHSQSTDQYGRVWEWTRPEADGGWGYRFDNLTYDGGADGTKHYVTMGGGAYGHNTWTDRWNDLDGNPHASQVTGDDPTWHEIPPTPLPDNPSPDPLSTPTGGVHATPDPPFNDLPVDPHLPGPVGGFHIPTSTEEAHIGPQYGDGPDLDHNGVPDDVGIFPDDMKPGYPGNLPDGSPQPASPQVNPDQQIHPGDVGFAGVPLPGEPDQQGEAHIGPQYGDGPDLDHNGVPDDVGINPDNLQPGYPQGEPPIAQNPTTEPPLLPSQHSTEVPPLEGQPDSVGPTPHHTQSNLLDPTDPTSQGPTLNPDLLNPIAPGPTLDHGLVDQIQQNPQLVNAVNQNPDLAHALEQDPSSLAQLTTHPLSPVETSSVPDPSLTDPGHTDPSLTDPGHTEPSLTDPAHTDPSYAHLTNPDNQIDYGNSGNSDDPNADIGVH